MIYPEYLKENDIIGITACSCGVLKKIDKFEKSLTHFRNNGFNIIETDNVRTSGIVSSDAVTRWNELKVLYLNQDVKMINIASGGNFLSEMLPLVDLDLIKNNVKWIGGSSDPTSLLFYITTNLDIATIYTPCNMCGYDSDILHESYNNYFKIIKGDLVKQVKFDKYEDENDNFTLDNEWINYNGNIDSTGILIGGCIECIKDIIGTKFDKTNIFLEKYKDEGIIWYFDVFSMSPESLCNTLNQFRNAGWFDCCKAILIGKVKYPTIFGMSYEEAISRSIKDIPCVYKYDIGHVKPSFTMINGVKVKVICNENDGILEYLIK